MDHLLRILRNDFSFAYLRPCQSWTIVLCSRHGSLKVILLCRPLERFSLAGTFCMEIFLVRALQCRARRTEFYAECVCESATQKQRNTAYFNDKPRIKACSPTLPYRTVPLCFSMSGCWNFSPLWLYGMDGSGSDGCGDEVEEKGMKHDEPRKSKQGVSWILRFVWSMCALPCLPMRCVGEGGEKGSMRESESNSSVFFSTPNRTCAIYEVSFIDCCWDPEWLLEVRRIIDRFDGR